MKSIICMYYFDKYKFPKKVKYHDLIIFNNMVSSENMNVLKSTVSHINEKLLLISIFRSVNDPL